MRARTRELALVEGTIAGFLFGTAAIFVRYLQDLDAFSIAFWRLIVACAALSGVLAIFRRSSDFSLAKKNLGDFLILSFFLGLHFIFFISAVKDTTILNATVLVNTTPILSVLISRFVFKVKPSSFAVVGLAISAVGICIIAVAETMSPNQMFGLVSSSPSLKGDLEATVAALVEACYLNYGRRVRNQLGVLSIMLPVYLLTAVLVGIMGFSMSRALTAPTSLETLIALVGLGVLPTAIAHTLYFSSLSNLKSFQTSTMALLEPIGATILGVALFQEVPSFIFMAGAFLILIGIFFVIKDRD